MEITIEELKKGDEILVLGQAPKYIKILEEPKLGTVKKYFREPGYKTVRCRINIKEIIVTRNRWNTTARQYIPTPLKEKTYILDSPEETDKVIRIDLNYKRLWLVKREI